MELTHSRSNSDGCVLQAAIVVLVMLSHCPGVLLRRSFVVSLRSLACVRVRVPARDHVAALTTPSVRHMSGWKFWKKDEAAQQQTQQTSSSHDPAKLVDIRNTSASSASSSSSSSSTAPPGSPLSPSLRARLMDPSFRQTVFAAITRSGKLDDPRVAMLTSRPQGAQELSKVCATFAGMFSQQLVNEAQKFGDALPAGVMDVLNNKAGMEAILKDEELTLAWLQDFFDAARAAQTSKINK